MILVTNNINKPFAEQPYELVERKGIGHPDTICDAIAERASVKYSKYCIEHFGGVAHHWFDKVMLIGGEADVNYGKGTILKAYQVIYAGKAAYAFGNQQIPLKDILEDAAKEVLGEVLTYFNPETDLEVIIKVVDSQGPGRKNSRYRPQTSEELVKIGDKTLTSNDCNLLHAFAPLSTLESLVLKTEQYINGSEFKASNPDTGWDVKVFGTRHGNEYSLIVNMPFLASDIKSLTEYESRKEEVLNDLKSFIFKTFNITPELILNSADRGVRTYLTALGSVADTGDVGVVGRGNRLNGLITPMRPMSIEAPAGKNPLDHTGKIYGLLAQKLADTIHDKVGKDVEVHIFTTKEALLTSPDQVVVKISDWKENESETLLINEIVKQKLDNIDSITEEFIYEGVTMW